MIPTLLLFASLACNNKLSPEIVASDAVPLEPVAVASAGPLEMTEVDAASGPVEAGGEAEPDACAGMDLWGCLDAPGCTLELQGTEYICRAPADVCEDGFIQRPPTYRGAEDQEESCLARSGCAFSGAVCFCPEGDEVVISCICGGGPPPYCRAE